MAYDSAGQTARNELSIGAPRFLYPTAKRILSKLRPFRPITVTLRDN